MTRYLVAGADPVDAGKTTFATGLLARVGGLGAKPRAGNDHWFDHDDVLDAVADGRLYGKDAARLAAAADGDDAPEAINPVHRLWRPAPGGDGFVGAADRQYVLDRAGDGWIVNEHADVPPAVAAALPLGAARRVSTVAGLNAALEALAFPAIEALEERVRAAETVVVESYGDVARPMADLAVDRVAVVEPGRARVYDGERYGAAADVAGGRPRDGRLEERVGDVVDLLEPEATVALAPLRDAARREPARVAEAYAPAYDALVADG